MADMREALLSGDRKGCDHQICPPRRGKTPCPPNTRLKPFMTVWVELVQELLGFVRHALRTGAAFVY